MAKPGDETCSIQSQTIADFGEQWQHFTENDGYYGESELFADILRPFLSEEDLRGKAIAEIGSGSGRIVRMLCAAAPRTVYAVEPSAAFRVLERNTAGLKSQVVCVNSTGDNFSPPEALDFIFSIGVIHHIPDPLPTLHAAHRALKHGARLIIWVYGKEGNELYLALVEPLRAVFRRLPMFLRHAVCYALTPLLWCAIRSACVLPLPMRRYLREVLSQLSFNQLRLNIFDQLNPRYAKYYGETEVDGLLRSAGFTGIKLVHRHGYSWTASGTKP